MKLKVLGSSSSGNSYVFTDSKDKRLIVDAGVNYDKLLEAIDYDIDSVVGVLITHEHGDHLKKATVEKLSKSRINIYTSRGTKESAQILGASPNVLEWFGLYGGYKIMPFSIHHDAAEPWGFLIYHPEFGTTLFATDTYMIDYDFGTLNNILIECNYDPNKMRSNMDEGVITKSHMYRVVGSHMSLDGLTTYLDRIDRKALNNLVLIHLSGDNADRDKFIRTINENFGIEPIIAHKGMEIEFNKKRFAL